MTQQYPGPNGWQQYPGQQQAPAPQWAPPGAVPAQGAYQAPPPVQIPPKKRRKWPYVVGGLFVLFFVIPALANSGSSSTPKTPTTPAWSSAAPVAPAAAVPAGGGQTAPAAPAAAAGGPASSFGDGIWVVGEDIVPGTYKSTGAQEGVFEFCAVTTRAGDTSDSKVVDIATANANEPMRIKVSGKVKSVEAHGCEDFTKVG